MEKEFPLDPESILQGLRGFLSSEGATQEAELLRYAQAQITQTAYDNWNGGTYYYCLHIRVPPSSYKRIANESQACEDKILEEARIFSRPYPNDVLDQVCITPTLPEVEASIQLSEDEFIQVANVQAVDAASGRSASEGKSDAYSHYETGLDQLRDRVKQDHPRYSELLVYQQRLTENIRQSRRYGDVETRKADRSEIIDRLNVLSLSVLDMSFTDLCGLSTSTTRRELSEHSRPRKEDHPDLGYLIIWRDRQAGIGPIPPSDAMEVHGDILVETTSHDIGSNTIAFWLENGNFGTLQIHDILRGSVPRQWRIPSFSGRWWAKNLTMIDFRVVESATVQSKGGAA